MSKNLLYLMNFNSSAINRISTNPQIMSILNKVRAKNEQSFESLVSNRNPFRILEDINSITTTQNTTNMIFCLKNRFRTTLHLKNSYKIKYGQEFLGKYKLFISKADGAAGQIGNPIPARIIGKAEFGDKNTICSETFLVVGPFRDKQICNNVTAYMQTKFFRFMVGIRKNKNMTHDTYLYAPIQDFSKIWTDEELYKKYKLDNMEIDYIESMIRPME